MYLTNEDQQQIKQFRSQAREDRELIEAIRQARLNARLKQEDVAAMLGVDTSTISRIETGKTSPTLLQLQALAVATGVRITYTVTPYIKETVIPLNATVQPPSPTPPAPYPDSHAYTPETSQ